MGNGVWSKVVLEAERRYVGVEVFRNKTMKL